MTEAASPAQPAAVDGPPLAAVILDMDGLLIDTEPVWRAAEAEVFAELGTPLTDADMLTTMGRRITEVVAEWRTRRPWPSAETGEPDDDTIAERVIDRMVARVGAEGEPMPGVIGAVGLLQRLGLPMAIASSSPHRLINSVCDRLGLAGIAIRCSATDEQDGKPAADVYLSAARQLGLDPAACLAIEDSPNGVVAAKAAGMRCAAVPDPHLAGDARFARADLVLRSLADLDETALRSLGWRDPGP